MEPYSISEKRPQHPGFTVPEYLVELRRERVDAIGFGLLLLFAVCLAVGLWVL